MVIATRDRADTLAVSLEHLFALLESPRVLVAGGAGMGGWVVAGRREGRKVSRGLSRSPEERGGAFTKGVLIMHYDEFTGQVQARAQLPDRQAAERAVRATLETLAERIPDGLASHLAAQLPVEAGECLRRVAASHEGSPQEREWRRNHGERFGLTGFAGRIAWRGGMSEEAAIREAAATFEVLDSAVSPELMEKLYGVLPKDIRALLPEARAVE